MKVLMLVPYLPTITMSGGQTRWYNIIKYLAKKHDITLFSLIKDDSEKKFIPELEKYCKKVKVFSRPRHPLTTRLATLAMRSGSPTEVPPYFWTIRDTYFNSRRFLKGSIYIT